MSRSPLLAATAAIALVAGSASVTAQPMGAFTGLKVNPVVRDFPGMTVLYNQNRDGDGYSVNSQIYDLTYTSGVYTVYNDQAADDFVVPQGRTWKVTEIDVTGSGSGTPASENVYFYWNDQGRPGKPVKGGSFTNLNGSGDPDFAIRLRKGVRLRAGHYWVSVQANCAPFLGCSEWDWATTATIANHEAIWEQPDNAYNTGCRSWHVLEHCFGSAYAGDFMFALKGRRG
ncbi:MAG TPA: hypothetical protein VHX61_10470 [Rhizomicrobium sp.]|nr:hypothetical protein [Rhizomicrobium sp.]